MLSIPQLSAPLTKAIRTSEGVLVWLTNLGLTAGALVDPSKLPPKEAAIIGAAVTGLHVASRTLLKVQALQMGVGIPQPAAPNDEDLIEHLAGHLADRLHLPPTVLDDVSIEKLASAVVQAVGHPAGAVHAVESQLVSDVEEFASQPPAEPVVIPESAITPDAPVQEAPAGGGQIVPAEAPIATATAVPGNAEAEAATAQGAGA